MKKLRRSLSPWAAGFAVLSIPAVPQMAQAYTAANPTIAFGSQGPTVSTAEVSLGHLGFYHGRIDGIFGPEMLAAVKAFQAQVGLSQDGIIGPLTWGKIDSASQPARFQAASPTFDSEQPDLRLGSTGPSVVNLQRMLNNQGDHLALDGDFGPLTYAAVRNFQASHGIPVDGAAGPQTLSLLQHLASGKSQATPRAAAPRVAGYLQEGDTGPQVAKLQEQLTEAGYSTEGIDGVFGPLTQNAVVSFQKAHNLPSDGLVGSMTWNALAQALAPKSAPTESVSRGTSNGGTGSAVAGYALQYRGYRYMYGGASPATGFDCSGLTQWVYHRFGVSLPRTSFAQWNTGTHVSRSQLQPGDLVFFTIQGQFAGHVGIYLGNNQFISAATPSQGVIIQSLNEAFWAHSYDGATRIVP